MFWGVKLENKYETKTLCESVLMPGQNKAALLFWLYISTHSDCVSCLSVFLSSMHSVA